MLKQPFDPTKIKRLSPRRSRAKRNISSRDMASTGPHIPVRILVSNAVDQELVVDADAVHPEAGPSMMPSLPPSGATITRSTLPVPPYEEEEEEDDVDDYAPELPPELAAARAGGAANPSFSSSQVTPRRTIGPAARGPLPCEEEEEESEDEIGPAPPPAGSSSDAREDAVAEFMKKEEQRRQAIEVR